MPAQVCAHWHGLAACRQQFRVKKRQAVSRLQQQTLSLAFVGMHQHAVYAVQLRASEAAATAAHIRHGKQAALTGWRLFAVIKSEFRNKVGNDT